MQRLVEKIMENPANHMKETILFFFTLLLMLGLNSAKAQIDPHFSQYYAYPLWLNPALTGVIDAEARVTANVREQWTGLSNNFKTAAVSADFRQTDKVALGVNIFNQKAGSTGYNYLSAYGSLGYQIAITANSYHKLNFGLQAGLINRSFDVSKLQMDDQYNPSTGFDPHMGTGENFASTGNTSFDANAGIFYYDGTPSAKLNFFGGISIAHLTQGKDRFTSNGSELERKVPMRYNLHGGARIGTSGAIDITPHLIYIRQQKSEIIAAGVNLNFNLNTDYSIALGGMYRINDAAVANVAFYAKSLVIGISYDHTTSTLQKLGSVRGGYEVSISYVFKRKLSAKDEKCPRL